MSSIYYKFKSAKDYDTIIFEGSNLPLWELKKEIITKKRLDSANDFELLIFNAQSNVEYVDDTELVSKNTSVIVKRVPCHADILYRPSSRYFQINNTSTNNEPALGGEDAKIQEMMASSSKQFLQNAEKHSESFQQSRLTKKNASYARPTPANYVCYRCGQKGHFVQQCPGETGIKKIRKATGIPKTLLKTIQAEEAEKMDNVMVTPEGGIVIQQQNNQEWDNLVSNIRQSIPIDLKCMLCSQVLRNALQSPCCAANFCDECVTENQKCPSCNKTLSIEKCKPNLAIREKIRNYMKRPLKRRRFTPNNR